MRTLLINIRNFLLLICIVYISIPLIGSSLRLTKEIFGSEKDLRKANLPNYVNVPWAKALSREQSELWVDYMSFIGWRTRPFTGETVNVDPVTQIRFTPEPQQPLVSDKKVFFFGGSTMWGRGSNDAGTIPSQFQKYTRIKAINYGEGAWIAHQSLNQLIKLYIAGERPDIVVFYDGVNEVHQQCRSEHPYFSAAYEPKIRELLNLKEDEWAYYLRPLVFAANQIAHDIGLIDKHAKKHQYNCDVDVKKADLISTQLVVDWKIAKQIVESYGGKFYSFLQPVAYTSKTRLDHIADDLDKVLGDQYLLLYPLIRQKMKAEGIGVDLSRAFDRDEYIFIDYCHVSPNGNDLVAKAIADQILHDNGLARAE